MTTKNRNWKTLFASVVAAIAIAGGTAFQSMSAFAVGPTGFTAAYVAAGTPHFTLSWTSDGSSSYTITHPSAGDGSPQDFCGASSNDLGPTTTQTTLDVYGYNISGDSTPDCLPFTSAYTYYFDLTGNSGLNEISAVFSNINFASAPLNLAATPTSTSLTLNWDAPATQGDDAITGYQVAWTQDSPDNSTFVTSGSANVTTTTYTFANPAAGTYFFTVNPINGADGTSPNHAELSSYSYDPSAGGTTPNTPSSGSTSGKSVKLPDTGYKLILTNPVVVVAVGVIAATALLVLARVQLLRQRVIGSTRHADRER
jgi:hypothetical protein